MTTSKSELRRMADEIATQIAENIELKELVDFVHSVEFEALMQLAPKELERQWREWFE